MSLLETIWCTAADRVELPNAMFSTHPAEIEKFAKLLIAECARVVNDNDFPGSDLGTRLLYEHFDMDLPE